MRKFVPHDANLIPSQAERKFTGEIFDVYQWPQTMFDGSLATFEMLKRPDTVIIIAVKNDKIVTIRQKQPRKDWYYSFPGGRVDADDANELAAAKRELREEAGMVFKNWKLINVTQPLAKLDWLVYTFLATDFVEEVTPAPDAGEQIETVELTFAELQEQLTLPNARDLKTTWEGLGKIEDLAQLLALPAIYNYQD